MPETSQIGEWLRFCAEVITDIMKRTERLEELTQVICNLRLKNPGTCNHTLLQYSNQMRIYI